MFGDEKPRIYLADQDINKARQIAIMRAKKGNSLKFANDMSEYHAHFIGLLGELAFAEFLGVEANLTYYENGGDEGHDFYVDGLRVEVKTRDYDRFNDPDLLVRPNKAKADLFVLAEVRSTRPNIVRLVGWATLEQLTRRKIDLYGGRYIVDRGELVGMGRMSDAAL